MSRDRGGRGLIGVIDCHRAECTNTAEYLSSASKTDPLCKIILQAEEPKKHGIMSYLTHNRGSTDDIDKDHEKKLLEMKLHGNYFEQQEKLPDIDLELSRRWLSSSFLRYETESLICAAQEQVLATNHIRTKIWGTSESSLCRLCKEQNETVHHIVSGCKMLCATQYLHRHNQVARYLHWNILRDLEINVSDSWMKHKPLDSTSKDGITVMWDMSITTDKKVLHNKPDIIIHDRNKRTCIICDVAVPVCYNVVSKTAEKITKYHDLEIELQKCWNLKEVRTVPIVIGALGSVCKSFPQYAKVISPNIKFNEIQRTALLGTTHILRNFLTPYKILPS